MKMRVGASCYHLLLFLYLILIYKLKICTAYIYAAGAIYIYMQALAHGANSELGFLLAVSARGRAHPPPFTRAEIGTPN